jgi:hypothetical protein
MAMRISACYACGKTDQREKYILPVAGSIRDEIIILPGSKLSECTTPL